MMSSDIQSVGAYFFLNTMCLALDSPCKSSQNGYQENSLRISDLVLTISCSGAKDNDILVMLLMIQAVSRS